MRIGYSLRDITPEYNMELIGFTPSRMSTGIHSKLHVKVLTLTDGDKRYAWMVTDLLGNDLYLKEQILSQLETKGYNYDDFQMFSTHTHSGPRVLNESQYYEQDENGLERQYFDRLVSLCVDAFIESNASLEPFKVRIARSMMEGFQSNRINQEYEDDKEVLVVEVILPHETILLYSFGGHPTILDRNSTLYSSDYVGEVDRVLQETYPFTMFFNAPCGDMSTRFYRKESSPAECRRLGTIAANCVKRAVQKMGDEIEISKYEVHNYNFDIQLKKFDTIDEAQRKVKYAQDEYDEALAHNIDGTELRIIKSRLEGALVNEHLSKGFVGKTVNGFDYSIIKINDYDVITLSSEVFSELVKPLKAKGNTWLISLGNQYRSYLPNKRAYDIGSYEALSSIYERGEGERLVKEIEANR